MRYDRTLYARSLFEVLKKTPSSQYDLIIKNFWTMVVKYGDQSKVDSIVDSFEELVVKNNGGRVVSIEVAREISQDLSSKFHNLFKSLDLVRKSVNPKLVAGVRVEFNGELELDYSLARKFRKMFTG